MKTPKTDTAWFAFRAAGVILHEGYILLQHDSGTYPTALNTLCTCKAARRDLIADHDRGKDSPRRHGGTEILSFTTASGTFTANEIDCGSANITWNASKVSASLAATPQPAAPASEQEERVTKRRVD